MMTETNTINFDTLSDLLTNLFAREEFAAQLLQRSFKQPVGWIELGVVLALGVAMFLISNNMIEKGKLNRIRNRVLRHLVERLLLPILLLITGATSLLIWSLTGQPAVWLRLLVFAANWMLMIRAVLVILRFALPTERLNASMERTSAAILWGYFLLWVLGIDEWIIHWMKSMQFSIGSSRLSLFTLLTGLLWVGIIMVLMMWLAKWLNERIMASQRLDINLRIVLSKTIKTILMVLSVLIALPIVGIDLTVLSVFGGALGVGLGFGLQKIASNYVSGFIILADRSIRPGDRLTVNNFTGYVTEITSRYVVLNSLGGQSALIPNETFVTSTVINESYTSNALYQHLNIQVAYNTDLKQALQIMKEAAAAQPRIEKEPNAYLIGFGDNGVDLRVGFWVRDPENNTTALFSAILMTIWERFNEVGIEFPYPQREVRIVSDETQSNPTIALDKNHSDS